MNLPMFNMPAELTDTKLSQRFGVPPFNALEAYQANPGDWMSSSTHAAAIRASQDVSRALVLWRKGTKPNEGLR